MQVSIKDPKPVTPVFAGVTDFLYMVSKKTNKIAQHRYNHIV